MVISGVRHGKIYPQEKFSWELSLLCNPSTGQTNFVFSFSGINNNTFEIFKIKDRKIYSYDNYLLGGCTTNNITFSGEINNSHYSLYQNSNYLLIGKELPENFSNNLINGFKFESLNEPFIDFNSLKILGTRPEYFIDSQKSFNVSEITIPLSITNSGQFPFLIYSGISLNNAFSLNIENLLVPANNIVYFNITNKSAININNYIIPILLYSEIGTLQFNINLSGFKIDDSIYYLNFGPQSERTIRSDTQQNYILNYYNINGSNLLIELNYISGFTGDYKPLRQIFNQFNSGDTISFINNNSVVVKNIPISGFITGSGILSAPIEGIISYFNTLNNEVETGLGIGLATGFKIAEPPPLLPLRLLQNFTGSGDFGFSSAFIGNNLYISSPKNSVNGFENGAVNIFNGDFFNGFQLKQVIFNPDMNSTGDQFGFSMHSDANNNRLFIGSPFNSISGITGGAVWIYSKNTLNSEFILKQKLTNNSFIHTFLNTGTHFGYNIKSNFSGDKIFISEPYSNNGYGSINFFTTSLNSIHNIYEDYILQNVITGYQTYNNLNLQDFGKYIYTNKEGNLLLTSDNKFIYIFEKENINWKLNQSILIHESENQSPYFYANNDCSTICYKTTINGNYINIVTGSLNTNWNNIISTFSDGFFSENTKYIIDDNRSLFSVINPIGFEIFTGFNDNGLRDVKNIIQIYNPDTNMVISHDGSLIGFSSGNNGYNLYNYYPPNFVSFDYTITLTGIGDADLFTDIEGNAFISGLKYEGFLTLLGGYLNAPYDVIGTGVQRDDYYQWEYDNQGILRKPTALNDNSLDILCRFRPDLSVCRNRFSNFDRPIITGRMTGITSKFFDYTGIIYADFEDADLTNVLLTSPLKAVTGRYSGLFDIIGFATAIGFPSRVSGKILGDFAQNFEPGSWTITKPWAGYISGNEFLNLLDEEAFNIRLLTINKIPTSGFIISGLKIEKTFKDFCAEDLSTFPPNFEISGIIPPFVRAMPILNKFVDNRLYRFGKDVFAVTPILSGIEWQYENSDFQLQSGFQFIFSGYPVGGRTRISRLGYTPSGSGYFNNLFQLPFYAEPEANGQYIGKNVTAKNKEIVGLFDNYKVQKTDVSGNLLFKQRLNFLGQPEFKQKKKCQIFRDINGLPIFDEFGNTIIKPSDLLKLVDSFDEEGNPILDTNNRPIQTYDCEPELDSEGNIIIDYYYQDEFVMYNNLSVDSNNVYPYLSGIRLNKNKNFYLIFNGSYSNSNIFWESAFEESGPWKRFSLYDINLLEISGIESIPNSLSTFSNYILSGTLPYGYNYFRIKTEIIDNELVENFPNINFSGTKKSLIPILVADYYEITNKEKFAGWEESLETVDATLYTTGTPPCIEQIRADAFLYNPCDLTLIKIKVVEPSFYKIDNNVDRSCFINCFNTWPKFDSIIIHNGFFSGYTSHFYKQVS